MSSETKGLIGNMSRKWKLDQMPNKKLEVENKLMEERLNQLKNEFIHDREKRNALGGTIWSKAQPGPVTNYAKNVLKQNQDENLSNKLSNRQVKLSILRDEYLSKKSDKTSSAKEKEKEKDKRAKCGQCERNLAFTRCLECCEDYCANCFTSFHMKGALQKHRTVSIPKEGKISIRALSDYANQNSTERDVQVLSASSCRSEADSRASHIPDSAPGRKTYQAPNSLLYGHYDEKQAQESFQQALAEWRNGKNANNQPNANKVEIIREKANSSQLANALINTDLSDAEKARLDRIKKLENYITTNHELSYADRILLQKYRKNELEFANTQPNSNRSQSRLSVDGDAPDDDQTLRNTINLANSQHIKFESIMDALNVNRTETNRFQPDGLSSRSNSSLRELNVYKSAESVKNSVNIEELETEGKKPIVLKKMPEPDLMLTEPVKLSDSTTFNGRKTPLSSKSRPSSSKSVTKSAPLKNENTSSLRRSSRFESNLSSSIQPNSVLREIAARKLDELSNKTISENFSLGEFLVLDVKSDANGNQGTNKISRDINSPRPVSSRVASAKLSNKFYMMSPRSWNPGMSVAVENTTATATAASAKSSNFERKTTQTPTLKNTSLKSTLKKDELDNSIKLATPTSSIGNLNKQNVKRVDEPTSSAKSVVFKKAPPNQVLPKKLDILAKSAPKVETNPRNNFMRNKSFHASVKVNSKSMDVRRPASSREHEFRPSSRVNTDFANDFLIYDGDDGRSSIVFQNQEDDNYYGELEQEFKSVCSNSDNENIKTLTESLNKITSNIIKSETTLNSLSESFSKNLTNLEASLRDDDDDYYDDNSDLQEMALEELKHLK